MVSTASTPSFENQLLKRANSSSILFFGVPVCTTFSFGVLQMKRLDEKRNLFKNPNMVFGWPRLQSRPRQCEHSRLPQTHHHRYLAARERNAGGSAQRIEKCPALRPAVGRILRLSGRHTSANRRMENRSRQQRLDPAVISGREKRPRARNSVLTFLERLAESMDTVDYCDDRKLGQVTFTGIVRSCDEKNRFMPENNVEKKRFVLC